MDKYFFQRLASQSNKYARTDINKRSSTMYIGHKWTNITPNEMIRFFGILLKISCESRKMGGYASYFTENPMVRVGDGYSVDLWVMLHGLRK